MTTNGLASVVSERLNGLRRLTGRPLRFVVAGGINTVFGLGIYPTLLLSIPYLHGRYYTTLGISQVLGLVFAFIIYKFGVFRTQNSNLFREIWTFSSFYLINYAINWAALPVLLLVFHLPPAIAQTGFVLAVMVGSYFWHSRLSFRPSRAVNRDA